MLSIPEIGISLIFLALAVAVLKEVWWDNRPAVVRRRKDERLGRALRWIAEEADKAQAARQSGSISQEYYEELMARLHENEKDVRIWNRY